MRWARNKLHLVVCTLCLASRQNCLRRNKGAQRATCSIVHAVCFARILPARRFWKQTAPIMDVLLRTRSYIYLLRLRGCAPEIL